MTLVNTLGSVDYFFFSLSMTLHKNVTTAEVKQSCEKIKIKDNVVILASLKPIPC